MQTHGYYVLHIIALILLVTIVRHSAYMERRRNFRYNLVAICVCFALAGYLIRDYNVTFCSYWLGVLAEYLIYSATVFYFIFFVNSLISFKKPLMLALIISGVILLVMLFASPVTGWIFTMSPDGKQGRGNLRIFGATWVLFAFIATTVVNFKKYKSCELEDLIRLVVLFMLEVVAVFMQYFLPQSFDDAYIGSALMIILYYAFVIEIDSKYDRLTEVCSFTYFTSYADRLRNKGSYGIILFDVNGLKHTNDTMGHDAGDVLITSVAGGIKSAAGNFGKVFRVGGDEFVVILKSTDESFIETIAQKATENFKAKSEKTGIKVSASYGIAIREADEDIKDALKRADEKMYECKQRFYQHEENNRRK